MSITVTFLRCQRPELLGYFSDLELMWIFANQLFQTFGDVVALSIFVSSLHNCSGSCYWCTKPLPPVLPTFFGDSAEDTCSFQGIKCSKVQSDVTGLETPPICGPGAQVSHIPLSPKRTPVLGSCNPQCPQLFPSLPLDAHEYFIPHAT